MTPSCVCVCAETCSTRRCSTVQSSYSTIAQAGTAIAMSTVNKATNADGVKCADGEEDEE